MNAHRYIVGDRVRLDYRDICYPSALNRPPFDPRDEIEYEVIELVYEVPDYATDDKTPRYKVRACRENPANPFIAVMEHRMVGKPSQPSPGGLWDADEVAAAKERVKKKRAERLAQMSRTFGAEFASLDPRFVIH